jgi:heme-degrading monooxygenase HmoA
MSFVPVRGTNVLFSVWDTRVRDFEAFVNATGYDATGGEDSYDFSGNLGKHGATWRNPGFVQGPTNPVCGVSWDDAKAFCAWLTHRERAEGKLKPNQEYRLPTDVEWSVAVGLDEPIGDSPARKDSKIKGVYPWGTQWPPPNGAGNYADLTARREYPDLIFIDGYDDGFPDTSPVGSFAPNNYGLYDMSGNVWQWCEDFYNGSHGARVVRGGSFIESGRSILLSSERSFGSHDERASHTGFRCVLMLGTSVLNASVAHDSAVQEQSSLAREISIDKAVLNNARQLAAGADQFFLENGVSVARLEQIVGPDKYVKLLNRVANESYPAAYTQGVTITISGVEGVRTITYAP